MSEISGFLRFVIFHSDYWETVIDTDLDPLVSASVVWSANQSVSSYPVT